MDLPEFSDIKKAHSRISERIHRTPVLTNRQVDSITGGQVFFKCENLQKVGAFKIRGASNAIFSLDDEEVRRGVATHSSGNHAQAVALSAKWRNIPAYIVMPENAPRVKVEAVQDYGAEITFCEPTQQAREEELERIVNLTGATFIHPYNDPRIVAGQGTAAVELLEQQPDLDMILVPVGGGGLISGTAIAVNEINAATEVIGTEPENADDAYLSMKTGKLVPVESPDTIADGLRTSLGELTFECLQKYVTTIVTVSEQEIVDAMKFIWERMKIIIEPSAAVPVAAVFGQQFNSTDKKIGIILSGGNVDLNHLPWI